MNTKLKIWQKIIIFILGTAIVVFTTIFVFISLTSKNIIYKDATDLTNAQAKQYALQMENWLNSDMAIARTLSNAFLEYRNLPQEQWQDLFKKMYNKVILVNPHIDAFWDSWEISNLDPKWDKPFGRYFYIVYRENGVIKTKSEIRSLTGDPPTYGAMKKAGKESIAEPYISVLQKGKTMTSLASPLFENGRFIGLIGIDLVLSRFKELIDNIKPFPNSYAFLLSNQGTFAAHPDTALYQKNITAKLPKLVTDTKLLERIQKGEAFSFYYTDSLKTRYFYSIAPISVGNTKTPWAIGIVVPERELMYQANKNYNISFIAGVFGLLILIIVTILFTRSLTIPINKITGYLLNVSVGKIDKTMRMDIRSGDEIAQMAEALNSSIEGLNNKTEFARLIGSGNLDADLTLLGEEDILGKSLIEMRDSLRKAKEEEETRKQDEDRRRWVNEGLAKFGEILRRDNNNLSKLSDEIIKNIVWYLEANQGGLFIANEKEGSLTFDLAASFAFDRKKYTKKSFLPGEGLVGTCAAEKDIVYITEIPQDYIEVTSGLGGANPNALILVPLKIDQEVLGVLELASFNRYKPQEIEFLQKISETVASTIRSVKVNAKTAELLEKSQEQAEMMAAQEEEMRQNMEELQATQEEAARKTFELEGLVNAVNSSSYVMEYDAKGVVINVNDAYVKLLGVPRENLIGVHHSDGLVLSDAQKMTYEQFWAELRKGNIKKQTTIMRIKNIEYHFLETYTPVINQQGEVYKVLKMAVDVTNLLNK